MSTGPTNVVVQNNANTNTNQNEPQSNNLTVHNNHMKSRQTVTTQLQSMSMRDENEDASSESDSDPNLATFYDRKCQRLKHHYHDQYLELFNSDALDETHAADTDFPDMQLGVVRWTAQEKNAFFTALDRNGRLDMPALVKAVGSKSELEIRDFLDCLEQTSADRQRFEAQTKNISHADIPAAVEVGQECEEALENAADALAAFQERYDFIAGQQKNTEGWLIHREAAEVLDLEGDEVETALSVEDQDANIQQQPAHLFHLSAFLDLSENVFMNRSSSALQQDWRQIAEHGQRPALTQEVVEDLFKLVRSLTQRILQTAIFIAKSRLRSTSRKRYMPSRVLTRDDMQVAIDILCLPAKAWDFWTMAARRNYLSVFQSVHRKDVETRQNLSLEQVEAVLSVRRKKDQRRPFSRTRGTSSANSNFIPYDGGLENDSRTRPTEHGIMRDAYSVHGSEDGDEDEDEEEYEESSEDQQDAHAERSSTESASGDSSSANVPEPISRKRRKIALEEAQDEYMESLDRMASRSEEVHLWWSVGEHIKAEENEELSKKPRTMRKTKDEIRRWACSYRAEWEEHGGMVPSQQFTENRDRRKRGASSLDDR